MLSCVSKLYGLCFPAPTPPPRRPKPFKLRSVPPAHAVQKRVCVLPWSQLIPAYQPLPRLAFRTRFSFFPTLKQISALHSKELTHFFAKTPPGA